MSILCNTCGSRVPNDSRFCTNCGHRFDEAQTAAVASARAVVVAPEVAVDWETKKEGRRKAVVIFAVIIAVVMSVVAAISLQGGWHILNRGPGDTLEAFHLEVADGKISEALNRLTGPELQMFGRDKFKSVLIDRMNKMKRKQGVKSIVVDSEDIRGETATAAVTIKYGDGTEERSTENLIKGEHGAWLISVQSR